MKIISEAINGGIIPLRFGKYGTEMNGSGVPCRSVPFTIVDAPEDTASYAIELFDVDSVPVCGFVWIHWLAANIIANYVPENVSINADFVQGVNSWFGSDGKDASIGYGGMTPPDKPHTYTLKVYALDCKLDLQNGFFYNEMIHAMKGHVLATAEAEGIYKN